MSYKPPFARMRQIKKNAPARTSRVPQNVDDAIAEAKAMQASSDVVIPEIRIPVGAVDAVIKPGEDQVYGTDDDVISIEGHKDNESEIEPEEDEPVFYTVPATNIPDEDLLNIPSPLVAEDYNESLLDIPERPIVEEDHNESLADIEEIDDEEFIKVIDEIEPVTDGTTPMEGAVEGMSDIEPEPEPESEPVTPTKPKYDMTMRKGELIAVAESVGLSSEGTKREIITRLDAFCE